jgi:hypothetical protein
MVFEHQNECESQRAAMASIAQNTGRASESLRKWARQAERVARSHWNGDDASACFGRAWGERFVDGGLGAVIEVPPG